jgi:hypothetical protein
VVQGMDVVDAIAAKATGMLNGEKSLPLEEITITGAFQIK